MSTATGVRSDPVRPAASAAPAVRRSLHALVIAEDEAAFAQLECRLGEAGFELTLMRVASADAFRAELARCSWDAVISDCTLAAFDSTCALEVLHDSRHDLPFLVISDALGETRATALMKAGAHDVIPKDQLAHLPGAVARELAHARSRRDRRKAENDLAEASAKLATLVEAAPVAIIELDLSGRVRRWNPAATRILGWESGETLGVALPAVPIDLRPDFAAMCAEAQRGRSYTGVEVLWNRKDGEVAELTLSLAPLPAGNGPVGLLLMASDKGEMPRLKGRLDLAQRHESIGQLASGLTHEISVPVQSVGHELGFLQQAGDGLAMAVASCRELMAAVQHGNDPAAAAARTAAILERVDIDYLLQEIPRSLGQAKDGIDRIGRIVRALKEVSHPGSDRKVRLDLNRAVECTATIARNEFRHVADLVMDLQPDLPAVDGNQAEIHHVLLNLLVNAAHAVGEAVARKGRGVITVSTRDLGDEVEILVHDTGIGIPTQVRGRIFEPFFTTKPVGKGTGQGLPAARAIVERHGGVLEFDSQEDVGTSFVVRLPCRGSVTAR